MVNPFIDNKNLRPFIPLQIKVSKMPVLTSLLLLRYGFKIAAQNGGKEKDTPRSRPHVVTCDTRLHSTPQLCLNLKATQCHLNGRMNPTTLQYSALTMATPRSRIFRRDICSYIILLRITLMAFITSQTQSPVPLSAIVNQQVRHIRMAPFPCIRYNTLDILLATIINVYLLRSSTPIPNK